MLDDLDDAALVAQHVAGDRDAFGVLVRRHRDRAWAVALRTLGDPTDAADAVQDAFLKAYRMAGGFRGEAQFTTWLHRIVINACLDLMRRRRVRPVTGIEDAALLADPADPLGALELATDVSGALARISEEQRLAIVLVDLEGFPVEQAAALLGVPTGTVKSRCHRGRAQLAILLGHLRPGTPDSPAASEVGPLTPETP